MRSEENIGISDNWVRRFGCLSVYKPSRSLIFQHHFFSRSLTYFRRQALATPETQRRQLLESNIRYSIQNITRVNTTKATTALLIAQHNTLSRDYNFKSNSHFTIPLVTQSTFEYGCCFRRRCGGQHCCSYLSDSSAAPNCHQWWFIVGYSLGPELVSHRGWWYRFLGSQYGQQLQPLHHRFQQR